MTPRIDPEPGMGLFRIVVPLDDSELSTRAVPWAIRLAGALDADVELLTVLPDGETGGTEEIEAQNRLAVVRSRFPDHKKVKVDVVGGEAEELIAERAQAAPDSATMVVMSTRAREGLERAILGSTTAGVIRRASVPVLTLRPEIPEPDHLTHRMLVPLDGSALSAEVIPPIVPFARALGCTLYLLSIVPLPIPGVPVQGATIPVPQPDIPDAEELQSGLDRAATDVRDAGIPVETTVAFGDRVEAVVRHAERTGCGLIAMTTHGRSGLERFAIGSLAEALIHQAPVPVIALRPRPSA